METGELKGIESSDQRKVKKLSKKEQWENRQRREKNKQPS